MAVKELREKADALSKRIFELRDKSNDEKREWTAEDESNWETLNADYDRTVKQTERETRCDTIHSYLDAPAGDSSFALTTGDSSLDAALPHTTSNTKSFDLVYNAPSANTFDAGVAQGFTITVTASAS